GGNPHHAYDFLGSWAQAVSTASTIGGFSLTLNPCGQEIPASILSICNSLNGTTPVNVNVPNDNFISATGSPPSYPISLPDCPAGLVNGPVQARICAFEALYGDRTIQVYSNAAITNATLALGHNVGNGGDTGDSDVNYTLTYTSTSTQVMVKFAGHLAVSIDGTGVSWGSTLGSGAISGGPYHFSLD